MAKELRLLALPGDGIGPEITAAALAVLMHLREHSGFAVAWEEGLIGGAAIESEGSPLPDETLKQARECDAVLLGAVGGPRWDSLTGEKKPEAGLLKIRSALNLFANLRPIKYLPELPEVSALKEERARGTDIMLVRELTGGLYFGEPRGIVPKMECAVNTMIYEKREIERVAHVAFQISQKRSKSVVSVDKANVLEVSRFWRDTVNSVGKLYPDVTLQHLYVDNCAFQLVLNPRQFDVILTENMFGDILSDEGAAITGSLGLLPSASLSGLGPNPGSRCRGLFEPVHGSAPDLAGQDVANPLGMLYSTAMLLRFASDEPQASQAADQIERAIAKVLKQGYRTRDLASAETPQNKILGTAELAARICNEL